MSRREHFSWIRFCLTVGEAVLVLLSLRAPLPAQSDDYRVPQAPPDFRLQAMLTRSAPEIENPVTPPLEDAFVATSATPSDSCTATTGCDDLFVSAASSSYFTAQLPKSGTSDDPDEGSKPPVVIASHPKPSSSSNSYYYRNRLEFSLDGGWLPINIPFVFDVFLGDGYNMTNLKYTLVPLIASLRWQIDNVGGPWIFRGNWDLQCSGAVTLIPRGPETRYFAWILGFRRNFVPRSGRIAPYFDGRVGLGDINAKEPLGVLYAQGQDFTFTLNMGSGVRYNFSPRYSITAGLNWMHISNLYLSQPQFANYGINVYGPMFGIDVLLGRLGHHPSE